MAIEMGLFQLEGQILFHYARKILGGVYQDPPYKSSVLWNYG
jgi:hypothetical protein